MIGDVNNFVFSHIASIKTRTYDPEHDSSGTPRFMKSSLLFPIEIPLLSVSCDFNRL